MALALVAGNGARFLPEVIVDIGLDGFVTD
jgi:hypothetical protein